ncbi:hypothetical protein F4861DRAFT_72759 [Xylaria intraflava]|nr:hypothetical protein F4861DRAFT_72759 [Xylaria intraflava]
MATGRKRPRPEEDTQAECPFTVTHPNPNEIKKAKRRRQASEDQPTSKMPMQTSPFTPMGKFKDPDSTMDRPYHVLPHQRWMDMTRYNSFVLNGVKYYSEGFIFVANTSTIERQRNPAESRQARPKSDDDWVARILEIRASDEHHVYARVYWMYSPDELPPGTQEGTKSIQGRQPYHGQNELIASNHMDVINVVSVTAQATVNQWDETNEDEVQQALYWRQGFEVRSMELSPALPRCKCELPENPDKRLINCTNSECNKWLHDDCLVHEALTKTFARLGDSKPHKPARTKTEEPEGGQRPLSPTDSGAQTSQKSIDVKPEDTNTIQLADVESAGPPVKGEKRTGRSGGGPDPRRKWRRRKSETSRVVNSRPYEGLFSAVINDDASPPVLEIRDLRENVTEGEKSWVEPLHCLLCGVQIY